MVWPVLLLEWYLEGLQFTIQIYHDVLRWILNKTDVTEELARWRLKLSEPDFEVVHRACVKRQVVETILRLPTFGMGEYLLEDDVSVLVVIKAQPEGEDTEADTKFWRDIPCNYGMYTDATDFSEV